MMFVIHMIDRPRGEALRAATAEAHREFVKAAAAAMYLGGPLLSDDGERVIGSVMVMDFPSREEAQAFIDREPYNAAGLFESVTIRRFGPVVYPEAAPPPGSTPPPASE